MSTTRKEPRTLADRHLEMTRTAILDAAFALVEVEGVSALTNRGIAERAGISERTVYRHFATRDALLDAVAHAYAERAELPAPPQSIDELAPFVDALYRRYEATKAVTTAALHPDLFERVRSTHGRARWKAVRSLVDTIAPDAPERAREHAAANVRFFLSATAWRYYREHFRLSLDGAIQSVTTAIGAIVDQLRDEHASAAPTSKPQRKR